LSNYGGFQCEGEKKERAGHASRRISRGRGERGIVSRCAAIKKDNDHKKKARFTKAIFGKAKKGQ